MGRRRNWDRVRIENRIWRNGSEPLSADPVHPRARREPGLDDSVFSPAPTVRVKPLRPGMVRCPECTAELNPANMKRHFARVHPLRRLAPDWHASSSPRTDETQPKQTAVPPAEVEAGRRPLLTATIRTSRQLADELTKSGLIAAFLLREAQALGATAISVDTALPADVVRQIRERFRLQEPGRMPTRGSVAG